MEKVESTKIVISKSREFEINFLKQVLVELRLLEEINRARTIVIKPNSTASTLYKGGPGVVISSQLKQCLIF